MQEQQLIIDFFGFCDDDYNSDNQSIIDHTIKDYTYKTFEVDNDNNSSNGSSNN